MPQAEITHTMPRARRRRRATADAALIRAEAEMERIAAMSNQTDRQVAKSSQRLCDITEFAAETPAASEGGLMAKALILRRELEVFGEPDESPALTLALSIVDDLIRLRKAG